jgi:hypothetical protein
MLFARQGSVFTPQRLEAGVNATHPQLLSKIHHKFIINSSTLYQLFVTFTVSYDTDRQSCQNIYKSRIINI